MSKKGFYLYIDESLFLRLVPLLDHPYQKSFKNNLGGTA